MRYFVEFLWREGGGGASHSKAPAYLTEGNAEKRILQHDLRQMTCGILFKQHFSCS